MTVKNTFVEDTNISDERSVIMDRQEHRKNALSSFFALFDVMTRRSRDVLMEKYNELVPENKKICTESFIYGSNDCVHIDPYVMEEATKQLGVKFIIYSEVKCYCFTNTSRDFGPPVKPIGFKEFHYNREYFYWPISPDHITIFKRMKKLLKNEKKEIERIAFKDVM